MPIINDIRNMGDFICQMKCRVGNSQPKKAGRTTMSKSYSSHPICQCCKNCHELADQSSDMQRQATKVAARASSAYAQIAQLDLQGIFNQLHRMKDILRARTNTNTMMSVH